MTFDPYSDSAASAAALIRKVFGCEYTDLFKGDPVVRLGQFAAMLDASQEQKWMPIETAPKNGFPILVIMKGFQPAVARWREDCWMTADAEADYEDGEYDFSTEWKLTHWMPLPQPPVDSKLEDSNG